MAGGPRQSTAGQGYFWVFALTSCGHLQVLLKRGSVFSAKAFVSASFPLLE